MLKLNAKQLRDGEGDQERKILPPKNDVYILLDNVLDTYNIGSAFRLADAVGAKRLILCGGSSTPPDHRIKKASINTTEWVTWQYFESAVEAIEALRKEVPGIQIVAVEQNSRSTRFDQFDYKLPLCIVMGHESEGVSQEVLERADGIVEMPMFGVNVSLNVVVSLGIVLYEVIKQKVT